MTTRMPVLFVGHGSPMNIIGDNAFTAFLAREGAALPRPAAILAISAHWESDGTRVLAVPSPRTIHDFFGFPSALYQVTYPAPGDPALATRVEALLQRNAAKPDTVWGLDHGTWSVLHHMFPKADVPVIQVSLNRRLGLAAHLELAAELKPLRDQGVLILASGNITHNLRDIDWSGTAAPFGWAVEFDALIKTALERHDRSTLVAAGGPQATLWQKAHPTLEHYAPLLYAVGASDGDELLTFPHEEFQHGSLSMRAVKFG